MVLNNASKRNPLTQLEASPAATSPMRSSAWRDRRFTSFVLPEDLWLARPTIRTMVSFTT